MKKQILLFLAATTSLACAQTYGDFTQVGSDIFLQNPTLSDIPTAKYVDTKFSGTFNNFVRDNRSEVQAAPIVPLALNSGTLLTPRPGVVRLAFALNQPIETISSASGEDMFDASFWCMGNTTTESSVKFASQTGTTMEWALWTTDIFNNDNITVSNELGETITLVTSTEATFERNSEVGANLIRGKVITVKGTKIQELAESKMSMFWLGARAIPVPEPSSSLMLLFGSVALFRRSR